LGPETPNSLPVRWNLNGKPPRIPRPPGAFGVWPEKAPLFIWGRGKYLRGPLIPGVSRPQFPGPLNGNWGPKGKKANLSFKRAGAGRAKGEGKRAPREFLPISGGPPEPIFPSHLAPRGFNCGDPGNLGGRVSHSPGHKEIFRVPGRKGPRGTGLAPHFQSGPLSNPGPGKGRKGRNPGNPGNFRVRGPWGRNWGRPENEHIF